MISEFIWFALFRYVPSSQARVLFYHRQRCQSNLRTNTDGLCREIHSGPFKNSSTVISSYCAAFTVNTIHLTRPQMRRSAVAGTESVTCHLRAGPTDRQATPMLSSIYGMAMSASVMTRGPEAELAESRSVCESRLVSD